MKPANNKGKKPGSISNIRLERLIGIEECIKSGKHPTARALAERFQVSIDTIYNDIGFMIDHHYPIDHGKHGGYFFTGEYTPVFSQHASEAEIEALHLVESALELMKQIPHAAKARTALKKVLAAMSSSLKCPRDWKSTVSFHTKDECLFDPDMFDQMCKAAIKREQVVMAYRKPGPKQQVEERVVEPHHLAKINSEWFVFAFDVTSQQMRTFIPARMKSIRKTGQTFQRQEFSIEKRLEHSFHVYGGDELHDVRIQFEPTVADMIREKKWGGQKGLRDLQNGGVELHLQLSSLVEVHRWLLTWGGEGVACSPPQLEQMIIDSGHRLACKQEQARASRLQAAKGPKT